MKFWRKISFLLFFCCFLFPLSVFGASDTNQKPEVRMTSDGKITWKTIDTKATTGITWRTEGYTVKSYKVLTNKLVGTKEYGNPVYKKPYGKFYNKEEYAHLETIKNGKYYYTWTIPKTVVDTQIKNAGVSASTLKTEGGYLYLNGFFRTYHNGKAYSRYLYDLDGIKSAEAWANPNDFKDRFDIPVKYEAQPVPVRINYQELYDGELTKVKTTNLDKQKPLTEFNLNDTGGKLWELIPLKMDSKYRSNKKVWAYKVTIQDIATGKTLSFPISNGSSTKTKKLMIQNNPITSLAAFTKEINDVRNRDWEVPNGGLQITVSYKYYKDKPGGGTTNTSEISDDYTDPQPPNNKLEGVIRADTKGNELFDVEQGIPTTEKTYSYVVGQEYLVSYTFTNYQGTKEYLQVIPSKDPKVPPVTNKIVKSYSYWKVTQLDVYAIDHATVSNYALPSQKITLTPSSSYQVPKVVYRSSAGMQEPVSGGLTVENIKVQNDYLSINGQVLMKDGWTQNATPTPSRLSKPSVINSNILFKQNMVIDKNKENGEWDSEGVIVYRNIKSIGESQGSKLEFDVDINSVVIHTPTVCDAQIEDVKKYNQLINPDRSSAGLVLDRYFTVYFPTVGTHNNYKNYGYRDYSKYIDRRQVLFPFDVYKGNSYIPANTWITITESNSKFYLPSWVDEGYYIAQFRSISINSDANNGGNNQEDLANYDLENYVAVDTVDVQVSGRVYGFNIYDITDYPIWQDVFRKKNSTQLTGNKYTVGTSNRNGESNGQSSKFTLSLLPGSHPNYKCQGAVTPGYVTRFSIYTMGNMYSGQDDYVNLKPTFYYVSKDGKTREEVDLYYTETINGKKKQLVKVGSDTDKNNKKSMKMGNHYTSVPETEIKNTANILGITTNQLKGTRKNVYTFGNIMLPWNMRTFVGTFSNRPASVSDAKVRRSIQKWYGEYYLPAKVHAIKKGSNVLDYAKKHGITYKESFWKKNGYIVVNFAIETIQDGERHLSYINPVNSKYGYCNMWKLEGFTYSKKDCKGNTFTLKDGDYAFFDLEKSVADDYVSGGTH